MTVDPSAMTEAGPGGTARAAEDAGGPVAGMSIGKYRLDRVLGAGGMGVVWAAYDPDLERPVAIKLLRSVDSAATLRTRLLREARAMARLKHPNVLTVYEVGTDRNRDYIAMELIDGADLDAWLRGKPPRAEIVAALLAAGRGLAAAHGAGLIHRDLKPHNILRGRDGGVYVTDFGLARGQIEDGPELVQGGAAQGVVGSQPRALDSVLDSPLTQTGVLIGTPAYMAPEQFAGRAPDPRSDQFAFCVTAWEALTGARPFAGKTLDELRAAASAGPGVLADVPEAVLPLRVRGVLARGLAPDPAARWPEMDSLLRALDAAIAPPRRSRWPAITAVVLAVVGFLTGVALYTRSHTAPAAPAPGSGTTVLTIPDPPAIPDVPVVPRAPEVPEVPDVPGPHVPGPHVPGPYAPPVPPAPPAPPRHSEHADRTHGATGDCGSAVEAFGAAWSAERRTAVTARHRTERELIAADALLDGARRDWIRAYEAACALPASEARGDRLDCLREARDAINEVTQELATDDDQLSLVSVVPLSTLIATCKQ
jgi:serine/threonine protein kinase